MERELTATHWRGYAQQQFPQSAWSVDGDVLRAIAAGPRVDLISRESFRDFVLCFDWRLPRDRQSTRLNSSHGYISHDGLCVIQTDDRQPVDPGPAAPRARLQR